MSILHRDSTENALYKAWCNVDNLAPSTSPHQPALQQDRRTINVERQTVNNTQCLLGTFSQTTIMGYDQQTFNS